MTDSYPFLDRFPSPPKLTDAERAQVADMIDDLQDAANARKQAHRQRLADVAYQLCQNGEDENSPRLRALRDATDPQYPVPIRFLPPDETDQIIEQAFSTARADKFSRPPQCPTFNADGYRCKRKPEHYGACDFRNRR